MKQVKMDESTPKIKIYLGIGEGWKWLPASILSDPTYYKNPVMLSGDTAGKEHCVMRGSYAGLKAIAEHEVTGKYPYHYRLAKRLGVLAARRFRKTGQRFFPIITSDKFYKFSQHNVKECFKDHVCAAFGTKLTEPIWRYLGEASIHQIGDKSLLILYYQEEIEGMSRANYSALSGLIDAYVESYRMIS